MPLIQLNGLQAREIRMQTRKARDIDNSQSEYCRPTASKEFEELKRRYPNAIFRTGVDAIYNCHGLTFGSRRTQIYKSAEIGKIIDDDMYHEVKESEILPGDVILYIDEQGEPDHSGIVIALPKNGLQVPWILSKWGQFGEAVHKTYDCPYFDRASLKYYRVTK